MECKFEVVIDVPDHFGSAAGAVAEQFLTVGCQSVGDRMMESYGDSLTLASLRLLTPPKP